MNLEYSSSVEWILIAFWAIGSLVLAWFVRRRFFAYIGSVGLSAPAIAYSMLDYGFLEMGGIIHALCAGVFALPFHYFFQLFRLRKQQTEVR